MHEELFNSGRPGTATPQLYCPGESTNEVRVLRFEQEFAHKWQRPVPDLAALRGQWPGAQEPALPVEEEKGGEGKAGC